MRFSGTNSADGRGSFARSGQIGEDRDAEDRGGFFEKIRVFGNGLRERGGVGVDRERKARTEEQIALEADTEPSLDAREFREAHITEFRKPHPKVTQAK